MIRRDDEDGVASTVATMFSLIIILMFMTAIFSAEGARQAELEWGLLREAQTSLGVLRSVHDVEFSSRLIPPAYPEAWLDGGVAVVIPVGMGSKSPFQPSVAGRLACDPAPSAVTLALSYRAGPGVLEASEGSGGTLSLDLGMRRIPGARLEWENGATLLTQGSRAVVVDYPYFRVEPVPDGVRVTYRAVRVSDDAWSIEGTGPQFLALRTIAADSYVLDVSGGGEANLDEVQQFVRDLAREIYDASTDGSDRITGSYADNGVDMPSPPNNPNPGILNQGLKEQLVYYNNALSKQDDGDCGGAANEMNASARQLLDNTMDKILEGIDTGFIDTAWGLDLHARLGTLHRCLDEMTGSLNDNCQFACLSLFGQTGGTLEFLIASDHRDAWAQWYGGYLTSAAVDPEQWEVITQQTFILVQIDNVKLVTLEVAYVTFG
jgi:hypothetical protein